MRRVLFTLSVLMAFVLPCRPVTADEATNMGGKLIYQDKPTIQFERLRYFSGSIDDQPKLRINKDGHDVEVPIHDIKSLTKINSEDGWSKDTVIFIKTRSGKKFEVKLDEDMNRSYLRIDYFNPVTGDLVKKEKIAPSNDLTKIVFGEHTGRLRYDPKSEEYFPAEYNYNPYNGNKLIWKSKESSATSENG